MRKRRLLLPLGACCLSVAASGIIAGQASASPALGSRFQSLGLIGEAGGARLVFTAKETKQPDGAAELDLPFAQVELSTIRGHAFAAVAWPGSLAGDASSTYAVLTGSQLPADANDPVRAETQTGSGNPSQTTDVKGGKMSASSTLSRVAADAQWGSDQSVSVGSLGMTHAHALGQVTGPQTAFTDTTSVTEDVALASGAITIGSITSHAHVTTNGVKTTGSGHTTVSDMEIGGVPVTVDDKGVHVKGSGLPAGAAVAAVNKTLAQTRTQIFLTDPHQTTTASGTSYDAGSLIVAFDNGGVYLEFGGAKAITGATLTFRLPTPPPPPPLPSTRPTPVSTAPPISSDGPVVPPLGGSSLPPVGPGPTVNQPPVTAPAPSVTPQAFGLPVSGLSPGWIVLALLGSAFLALGLRRFPDRVLAETATPCPLDTMGPE